MENCSRACKDSSLGLLSRVQWKGSCSCLCTFQLVSPTLSGWRWAFWGKNLGAWGAELGLNILTPLPSCRTPALSTVCLIYSCGCVCCINNYPLIPKLRGLQGYLAAEEFDQVCA